MPDSHPQICFSIFIFGQKLQEYTETISKHFTLSYEKQNKAIKGFLNSKTILGIVTVHKDSGVYFQKIVYVWLSAFILFRHNHLQALFSFSVPLHRTLYLQHPVFF